MFWKSGCVHNEAYVEMYLRSLVCVQNKDYVRMVFNSLVFVNNKAQVEKCFMGRIGG